MKYLTSLEHMLTKYDNAISNAVESRNFYEARLLIGSKELLLPKIKQRRK